MFVPKAKKGKTTPEGWLYKMDKEVKLLWTLGLRSKLYFQGDVHLRKAMQDVDRFDPLGVLCDLYAKEMGVEWVYHKETHNYSIHSSKHLLPQQVLEFAGLKRGTFIPIIVDGEKQSIVDISDMERKLNFEQIADIIDQCL